MLWNAGENQYVDTGVSAVGPRFARVGSNTAASPGSPLGRLRCKTGSSGRPITGWDGVQLTQSCGEETVSYAAQFPETVYGGSYNLPDNLYG